MKRAWVMLAALLCAVPAVAQGVGTVAFNATAVTAGGKSQKLAIGFDFRSTQAYTSDTNCEVASDCTYVLASTLYPTTQIVNGQTVTFGWETAPTAAANIAYSDTRLKGWAQRNNGTVASVFRVDLPAAGSYTLNAAFGCGSNANKHYLAVLDTSTSLLSFAPLATAAGYVGDATGTTMAVSAWPSGNASTSLTFSTQTLRVRLGGTVDAGASCIAHFFVTQN